MGWWWSSDPQTPVLKPSDPTPDPAPASSEPPASARELADKPTSITTRERDTKIEDEISQYIPGFGSEFRNSTSTQASKADKNKLDRRDASLSLYPSELSCRQLFDTAAYCQGMGGQFLSVYRYGNMRDCKENWSDFWHCMKLRRYGDEDRADMVRQFYKEKNAKVRLGRNSEDVWKARTEPVEKAFWRDPDEMVKVEVSKEEVEGMRKRGELSGEQLDHLKRQGAF